MDAAKRLNGIFAVYKEEGMTSHDVVDAVRRATGEKKVGHAGTLDPCARGVLVVGVGRQATRRLSEIVGNEKEYTARIRLGWRSDTDDREGEITQVDGAEAPSAERLRRALTRFEGATLQRPPAFSAIKVSGRAAYRLARARRDMELPCREVEAKEIELLSYTWPFVAVRLVTGPGFYVRSLARDLGEVLGTGGYLAELERTRVGPYTKERALRLSELSCLSSFTSPPRIPRISG